MKFERDYNFNEAKKLYIYGKSNTFKRKNLWLIFFFPYLLLLGSLFTRAGTDDHFKGVLVTEIAIAHAHRSILSENCWAPIEQLTYLLEMRLTSHKTSMPKSLFRWSWTAYLNIWLCHRAFPGRFANFLEQLFCGMLTSKRWFWKAPPSFAHYYHSFIHEDFCKL